MSNKIYVENIRWIWDPPILAEMSIRFGEMFIIHGFRLHHWMGEEYFEVVSPTHRVARSYKQRKTVMFEWYDPDFQESLKKKILDEVQKRSKLNLHDKDDLEYGWHKYANAVRNDRYIISKFGRQRIPQFIRTGKLKSEFS